MLMGADSAPIKLVKEYSKQELPIERISGLSVVGSTWVVGGIRGLFIGSPGMTWKKVTDQSIRQVVTAKNEAWVLYGNGSVDKLDVAKDQLYYDVFHGAVKRPWVGSISKIGDSVCFGGSGGWFEKAGGKSLAENYPAALASKNVTCNATLGSEKLAGTQDGLFVISGGQTKRLGFGDGLSDVWITSLVQKGSSVIVGTYVGGTYSYANHKLTPLESPSKKIRNMIVWRNQLVLGTLEGSWIQNGKSWTPLTKGETTFLTMINNSLFVGTPVSVTSYN